MQYSYYMKNKKKIGVRGKMTLFFTCILVIFAFFVMYVHFIATPLIERVSEAELKLYLTKAMNMALESAVGDNFSYDDIAQISFGESGDVKLITTNSSKINELSVLVESETLKNMQTMCESPITIPLGEFFGFSVFSGLGPPISFNAYPRGEVQCKFLSDFMSAGINQTHHKIYASVDATINVVLPLKSISVKMSSEVMVCESIIIGKVPDTYLCGALRELN